MSECEIGFGIKEMSPSEALTQQQAVTVIWIMLRPAWQMSFRYSGLCKLLLSLRSITSGVAFTDTCTDSGQLVFMARSSW